MGFSPSLRFKQRSYFLHYAENTACCLIRIAQCGTYDLADRRTLCLRKDSAG
jgi:hypothetical protein